MFDLIPFDHSFKNLVSIFDNMEKSLFGEFAGNFSQFRTDILDRGDSFIIQAELPGFDKKDISVSVRDNYLTIQAEHKEDSDRGDNSVVRRERRYGMLTRRFDVSSTAADRITAEYKNGVLEITLPKAEAASERPGRTIDIL
jgi:HSP20 family protein